jgi:hypothetical protein
MFALPQALLAAEEKAAAAAAALLEEEDRAAAATEASTKKKKKKGKRTGGAAAPTHLVTPSPPSHSQGPISTPEPSTIRDDAQVSYGTAGNV